MSDAIVPQPELTQGQLFHLGMYRTTPKVFVTHILIALNILVFVAMALNGVSVMEPKNADLLRWGADYGPLTTHGQYWRLLSSAFVHIGVMHILMNMYILYSSGIFVERLFGNLGFAVMYLLAGIGGNLMSVAWHPDTVAAGASGAVFGVYGALFAFLLMQRSAIPGPMITALVRNCVIFLGFNLVYGAAKSGIDVSAHIGGFLTGFVVGCALALPFSASQAARLQRSFLVAIAGLLICAGCALKLPRMDDLQAPLVRLETVESASLKLFNDSLDQLKDDKLTGQQFAEIVNKKLLPPWNAEKDALSKLVIPDRQKTMVNRLVQYMTLRAEGWSLTAQGASQNNSELIEQANQKQAAAQQIGNSLGSK